MDKFDVVFDGGSIRIMCHFCKEDGCFGTNETHGYSFDEAKEIVIHRLDVELEVWRTMSLKDWRRNKYPTEKEMYGDMNRAEARYAPLARDEQ